MNIFLDDIRNPPSNENWIVFRSSKKCSDFILKNWNKVEKISLDHDLGDEKLVGCGYDVILDIEEFVFENRKKLNHIPQIFVHSSNSSARIKMENGIESIKRIYKKN